MCIVRTRITSAIPVAFFRARRDTVVAVSHGEGRFVATEKELKQLF